MQRLASGWLMALLPRRLRFLSILLQGPSAPNLRFPPLPTQSLLHSPATLLDLRVSECVSGLFGVTIRDSQGTTARADPTPASDNGNLTEEGRFERDPIEPGHVLRGDDADKVQMRCVDFGHDASIGQIARTSPMMLLNPTPSLASGM